VPVARVAAGDEEAKGLDRDEEIARAIRQRDLESVMRLMFAGDPPVPRTGFKTETELWDFKGDCPKLGRDGEAGWAEIASDVLAFHNQRGGILNLRSTRRLLVLRCDNPIG
jgi:hypothetical protein